MANTLKLEIVTPDATVYSGEVDMVTVPGTEGEMGIYPMHAPLLSSLRAGEVVIHKDGQNFSLAVGDGFVEVTGEKVAILTDMAVKADDIDEVQAEEARRRAEARLVEHLDAEDAAMVNAALTHSLAQLKVKRRRHK